MKQLTTAILVIAIITGTMSCKKDVVGEGPITTETRSVANFTGINLQMNGTVYYKKDSVWKLEVSAKQSIHAMLETNVINGILVIRYRNGKYYDADETIRINVSGPAVSSFMLNTSGSIVSADPIQANNLYLRSWGSGTIWLQQVNAGFIDAETTVSGQIVATVGTANSERLKTDGSGKIDLRSVAAKDVSAHIVGSGNITVKVSDRLEANIDGSGSVYFSGYPFISTDIDGTGELIRF